MTKTDPRLVKRSILFCSALLYIISVNICAANNFFSIYPEAKLGWRSYKYKVNNEKIFDINFPSMKIGAYGEYKPAPNKDYAFFTNVYYETSLGSNDATVDIWSNVSGPSVEEFNRTDSSILAGLRYKDAGLFVGYKSGRSEINFQPSFFEGVKINNEFTIDSSGFFVGAGYGLEIKWKQLGLLGFKVAYSWLDVDVTQESDIADLHIKDVFSGDGNGISIGTVWIGSLAQKSQYSLELDWHNYEYDNLTGSVSSFKLGESQVSFRVGLTYAF